MNGIATARAVKSPEGKKISTGQTALRISRPKDAYEQQADHAAERVVSNVGPSAGWSLSKLTAGPALQRQCACGGECEDCKKEKLLQRSAQGESPHETAPPMVRDVLAGSGRPMDRATRRFMESRFARDFSKVCIFTDSAAATSARAVAANAYTVGEKIVFSHGRYAPDSADGRKLLAHELAHVVQQSQGGSLSATGHAVEGEAQSVARKLDSAGSLPDIMQGSATGVARDAAPGQQTLIEVKFPDGAKQLTTEEFAEYKRQAINNLRADLSRVAGSADIGRKSQTDLLAEYQGGVESLSDVFFKPKALIGIAADIRAGVTPPYIGMWSYPKRSVEAGLAACDRGDLAQAARSLQNADKEFREAMRTWNAYREATIGGAESVASDLETVRDVSFAVALVAGAAVAAPAIAAAAGAAGITGAAATVVTTAGTAVVTGAGGAVLGGGSTARGSLAVTGSVDVKAVKADAIKFGKQGLVTGLTAGLGTSLGAGAKLAQPLAQAAARRCLTEAGINTAGEVTSQFLDSVVPPSHATAPGKDAPKPLLPGPARAALIGCVSGALGVPVAKLGRSGTKAADLAVTGAVGYADARLAGQTNKEALLAAGQSVLTSAAVARGHAGTERAKAAKEAARQSRGSGAAEHPEMHPAESKSGTEKVLEKQNPATGHEGAPAVFPEDAKARAEVGGGHEVVVTEHGIGKCSNAPCPVIHVEYAKELQEHPWAKKRYEEIQETRKSNPEQAAKEAANFVRVLDLLKSRAGEGPAAPAAVPTGVKGTEVFDELRVELGNDPSVDKHKGGIRQAVADAKAAGFVKPDGSPGSIDLALHAHGSASTLRNELGVTGSQAQSAHIGPTAALKGVKGYSRSEALATLLPPETHAALDAHWKKWSHEQRQKGETHSSVGELHLVMVEAINQTPGISAKTKGALAFQLHLELFSGSGLGLSPSDRIPLPFGKKSEP